MDKRTETINKITDYIKDNIKGQKDAPGLVFMPTYRTEKQLDSDDPITGGILTNVDSVELLELAIHNAIRAYVDNPKYEKFEDELFANEKDEKATQTALIISSILIAALNDVTDWVKYLAALLIRTKDVFGEDREITFSVLPKDIEHGFDSAENNSGMVATADPNKQVHIFATMILSYCLKNNLDIEDYMNKIFHKVMTSDVEITKHGGKDK